ncbi:MAG TPA: hypothetical protein VH163_06770 [Gemmatimonadales bacterium]|jgi:hypothetical protein|nr:hypothetical protein [Gemmatimonadales bacterium]
MTMTRTFGLLMLAALPLSAQTPPAKKDSTPARAAAKDTGSTSTTLLREVFTYEGAGRDPFASLLRNGDVRPLFADLKLLAIYFDGQYPGRSVAVLRDIATQKRYQVKPGEVLGRLKVAQIRPRDVTFTVQEFGFERQETLSLSKPEESQ